MRNELAKRRNVRWALVLYDVLFTAFCAFLFLFVLGKFDISSLILQFAVSLFLIEVSRFAWDIYRQIWRFGGVQCYLRLICADACACIAFGVVEQFLPCKHISLILVFGYMSANLLTALSARMTYRYVYKFYSDKKTEENQKSKKEKQNIAIIGAGRLGVSFANDLLTTNSSDYIPRFFVDINKGKVGRSVFDLPVIEESHVTMSLLDECDIHTVVFCIQQMDNEKKRKLYEKYRKMGRQIKVYDCPTAQSVTNGKKIVRDFDIEELLFRKPIIVIDKSTKEYYTGKTVLITGGGGSIGSELCRQIAKMDPAKLIILDIAENGVYDIQQELRILYANKLDLSAEILSVCNTEGMERVFQKYRPQIVLHAAAHKHVPLMEGNPIEAISNNIFGTLNVVKLSDKYAVEHFIMISTDKAVNPTNVMGATKRFCEYIVQTYAGRSKTVFSATRFGNVLGSAGSVVPLFKKQIASGGPITVTDKRIIRYFMTIPEASQLVLVSGSMAHSGELFVLDMGDPVKIWELAENMISLCGYTPYDDIDIVETGLRPGEKLYEELLVQSETLRKTDNNLIYIEKDKALRFEELERRLALLKSAVQTGNQETAYAALCDTVPTFRDPNDVNAERALCCS